MDWKHQGVAEAAAQRERAPARGGLVLGAQGDHDGGSSFGVLLGVISGFARCRGTTPGPNLDAATTAVLVATVVAAITGLVAGRFVLRAPVLADVSESEAEASTAD